MLIYISCDRYSFSFWMMKKIMACEFEIILTKNCLNSKNDQTPFGIKMYFVIPTSMRNIDFLWTLDFLIRSSYLISKEILFKITNYIVFGNKFHMIKLSTLNWRTIKLPYFENLNLYFLGLWGIITLNFCNMLDFMMKFLNICETLLSQKSYFNWTLQILLML